MTPQPWTNSAALAVFRDLDQDDAAEAIIARGKSCDALQLWAEWWLTQRQAALSLVLHSRGGTPFAVLSVVPMRAGVAQAALLARRHHVYRGDLLRAGAAIRSALPDWAATHGIRRIEARSWAGHPRASRFLALCGFRFEARLDGYGPDGSAMFCQYAWIGDPHVHSPQNAGNSADRGPVDRGEPKQHGGRRSGAGSAFASSA